MSRRPAFFGWVVTFGIALVLCYGVTAVERWCHGREGKAFLALAALHLHRIPHVLIWLLDGPALPVMVLLSLADPLPAATGCLFAAAEWLIRLPARIFLALSPALAVSAPLWLAGPLPAASRLPRGLWKIENVLIFAALAAVMIRNDRCLEQPDLRRRIRWVSGIAVSLTIGYGAAAPPTGLARADDPRARSFPERLETDALRSHRARRLSAVSCLRLVPAPK